MRIVSLESYITDLLCYYGLSESIVGISHRCRSISEEQQALVISRDQNEENSKDCLSMPPLSRALIDLDALIESEPDIIVGSVVGAEKGILASKSEISHLEKELCDRLQRKIKLLSYNPCRLEEIIEESDRLARDLKVEFGLSLGKRAKAQLMDWGDNFYDRMKNKKVSFLSGIEPFGIAGWWVPDMIQSLSAISQLKNVSFEDRIIPWEEIVSFKPDVIVVAPRNSTLQQSMSLFKILEKLPGWETIPAVKRGEVVFCDGADHFYNPGPSIIDSFGILVSAIAGFESGYITKRDSFYRLRWLELQRHRI